MDSSSAAPEAASESAASESEATSSKTTTKTKQQQQPLTTDTTGNTQLKNTTACLPIAYGSIAIYLASKADEFATHEWTLYLRGPSNEDLSGVIQRVVFTLHPSFAQPTRELEAPPFQVTERGWGEFEAQIRIIWKDPTEKPTVLMHIIKLYPVGTTNMQPTKEPVVDEHYDEVVFTDPKESFYQQLLRVSLLPKISSPNKQVQDCFQTHTDEEEVQKLLQAQKFLQNELVQAKDKTKILMEEMMQVDQALVNVNTKKTAMAVAATRHR